MINIGVLVSSSGSNLQAIIDATKAGKIPDARVTVVISNKSGVYALERARLAGIESLVLSPKDFPDRITWCERMAREMVARDIEIVCLAGFLLKIEVPFIRTFPGRILNIHPALLPRYGGSGMYGLNVHKAVLAGGDQESGVTVHIVDEEYDHGPIIIQAKVPVSAGDTPEILAARVLEQEHKIYPQAINILIRSLHAKSSPTAL